MKRVVGFLFCCVLFIAPAVVAQSTSEDHAEVGIFAEYFRFNDPGPSTSHLLGLGGRAGFNVHKNVQIEAEMGYDFARNYTSTFSNGVTTATVQSRLRILHGFFGPKFQTSGPLRVFVTGKVGFENFSVSNAGAPAGFANAVGLGSGATYFALYPGGGIEGFFGPVGLRAEIGDNIFFNNGMHNNLRVSFGPQFRF
jgi:hypothetical protein